MTEPENALWGETSEDYDTFGTADEALNVLSKGVETWNAWIKNDIYRRTYEPKLHGTLVLRANLRHADLRGARLDHIDLRRVALQGANLAEASLINADLTDSHSERVDFSRAVLRNTDLEFAFLEGAQFVQADCQYARFFPSSVDGISFDGADLTKASFRRANFHRISTRGVRVGGTAFIDCDFSGGTGFDSWTHEGPSHLDVTTLLKSCDALSEDFLRKVGIPEVLIDYLPSLTSEPIQFYSCFISCSSADAAFADRLYADLQANGVRCWYAPKHMKMGDRIRDTIERSIRVYDKLIVILSCDSIGSDWVESEVENVLERERYALRGRNDSDDYPRILIPIKVDDAIRTTGRAWARTILRQRHVGDFTDWRDIDSYRKSLERLLRDIRSVR